MSLTLIGLGLNSQKFLSLEGLEIFKESGKIYLETYTSKWLGNIENLEKTIGKEVHPINRPGLVENSEEIFQLKMQRKDCQKRNMRKNGIFNHLINKVFPTTKLTGEIDSSIYLSV